MFKPEKNLKLSLNRHFVLFPRLLSVRFVSQFFAYDILHGYASFKHICNVIIGYMLVAWTKACLTFTRSLNHKKEEIEKRKNGLKLNFLSFPSLFFLFLSSGSLLFMSIFFFTYTREAAAIVFLCMFAFRKQETFLLYLRLYKKLYYSNFRIFLSRPNCMQSSTLLSASLRGLFRNLWCIVIIILSGSAMFFSPYFKTVHVHIDRAEHLAVNHRWRHLLGWSVQLTVDNETSKYWLVLIYIYRSRKIRSPTVRQCTFLQRHLAGTSSPMVGWQPCRRPPTTCSRQT